MMNEFGWSMMGWGMIFFVFVCLFFIGLVIYFAVKLATKKR